MNLDTIVGLVETDLLNLQGKINFPQVVQRMFALGVERYHVDYVRHEITFYRPDGETLVLPKAPVETPIAVEFSGAGVVAALKEIQAGKIDYPTFLGRTRAAGCVGYTAHIAGRRVVYNGRLGDCHVEQFPGAKS